MFSRKYCKPSTALAAFALVACQSEPTAPPSTPRSPSEPVFPIPGTFAFSRAEFRALRPIGFGASIVWIHDRAVREIADSRARFLQQPALSPDGTRMIVLATNALDIPEFGEIQVGGGDLFLLDAVATSDAMIQLTTTGSARSPDWSPDGQSIVYVSGGTGLSHLYVQQVSGGVPLRISARPGSYETPRWSPDGRQIVFTDVSDNKRDIFVMNADGSALVNLTPDAWSEAAPTWSPDGQHIAFSSARGTDFSHIFTVGAGGSNLTRLTVDGPGSSEQPVWSPDGLQIAFAYTIFQTYQYFPVPGSGIYVMYADGSQPRKLTDPPQSGFDRHPAWSR